jgi:predicted RNA-binding protein YlxR (DUF448 family)
MTEAHVSPELTAAHMHHPGVCVRTCVGCMKKRPSSEMLHIRCVESDALELDWPRPLSVRAERGRGAHLHAQAPCVKQAVRKGLARSFRRPFRLKDTEFTKFLWNRMHQRLWHLLMLALRQGKVEFGLDAAAHAYLSHECSLLILASDASEHMALPWVSGAIVAGRAMVLGTQDTLGGLQHRAVNLNAKVPLLTVKDTHIAQTMTQLNIWANAVRNVEVG